MGTLSPGFYEQTLTSREKAGTSAGPPSTRLSRIEPWPSELTVERGAQTRTRDTRGPRSHTEPRRTACDPVDGFHSLMQEGLRGTNASSTVAAWTRSEEAAKSTMMIPQQHNTTAMVLHARTASTWHLPLLLSISFPENFWRLATQLLRKAPNFQDRRPLQQVASSSHNREAMGEAHLFLDALRGPFRRFGES